MSSHLLAAVVLGLIAFQTAGESDPAELVTRLGAIKFADREKAGEDLVKLGRKAIGALKKASAEQRPGGPPARRALDRTDRSGSRSRADSPQARHSRPAGC